MKISREELSEIRKREQTRKEFENEIGRDLKLEFEKKELDESLGKEKNQWVLAALNFFGTLIFGYMGFFIIMIIIPQLSVMVVFSDIYRYFI